MNDRQKFTLPSYQSDNTLCKISAFRVVSTPVNVAAGILTAIVSTEVQMVDYFGSKAA